jgi:hypothetical protein
MQLPAFDICPRLELGLRPDAFAGISLAISKQVEESILASTRSWARISGAISAADGLNKTVWDAMRHADLAHRQLSQAIDTVRRQMIEATRFTMPSSFEDQLERSATALEPSARRLGTLGWTVPLHEHIGFVGLAVQLPENELDELFLDLYAEDNGASFQRLIATLRGRSCLSHHLHLIDECQQSYLDGRYLVVVPALLPLLERLVALAANSLGSLVPVRSATATLHLKSRLYRRVLWASIDGFVQAVFAYCDFQHLRPPLLNRHLVLHGRADADWTQADALRLFHALDTLSHIVESDLEQSSEPGDECPDVERVSHN